MKMIHRLLHAGTEDKIAHLIEKIHPSDLTILFSELAPMEVHRLVDSLFLVAKAGKTLRELPDFILPDILELIENKKLAAILARMDPDDALFLLEKCPESRWKQILDELNPDFRIKLDKLLSYPRNSAGAAMTSEFITVKATQTVQEAIETIRSHPDLQGMFYIYVIDDDKRLVGVQSIRQLVLSSPDKKVSDVMTSSIKSILATASREEAAQLATHYNFLAVPVVSESRELLGVITIDDVVDILQQEATEDIYHLAGLSGVDRALTPLSVKVKKRLPWMMLNLLTAALVATVVGAFQDTISQFVALAVFMPIVAGLGGNTATQSLTVVTRSLALGEFEFIKTYRAVIKETMNGLILGVVSGVIMGLVGWIWKGSFYLGVVLFIAMVLNLLMGGLMGATVPLLFKRFKLDPAVGTSVLVTMVTDGLGFFFFLGLATFAMHHLGLSL